MTLLTTTLFCRLSTGFIARSRVRRFGSQIPAASEATVLDQEQLVKDMLYRVRAINHMPDDIRSSLLDFQVDGVVLGKVSQNTAQMLSAIAIDKGPVFELQGGVKEFLTLSDVAGRTSSSRTRAVGQVMEKLRDEGVVTGWRDELYPVAESFYSEPAFLMERASVSLLGLLEYGVHINGLVKESPEDEPKMWIGRRSATKSKFPGMLDHLAAGGQPAALGLFENAIKECGEEAGVPEDLARAGIQAAGAISYESWNPKDEKLSRVVLFNYDLYLPTSFVPKPVDGEVEEFFLWSIDEIKESIAVDFHDPIKPNCYVVIIDYLLRMGYVSPDNAGYLDILRELRSGACR